MGCRKRWGGGKLSGAKGEREGERIRGRTMDKDIKEMLATRCEKRGRRRGGEEIMGERRRGEGSGMKVGEEENGKGTEEEEGGGRRRR